MKRNKLTTVALALCAVMLGSEGAALAQSARQKDKNDMRNLGLGLGALAIYKSIKGDPQTALLLGAGAAYAGKKYEDQRKAQNRERVWRKWRYSHGRKVGYWVMRGHHRGRYVRC